MSYPYDVDVLVNNKPITTYVHEGDTFVEGRPGSNYKIRVKNHRNKRIKAVISVDGLSIIDGKPASENSPGYILEGYETETFNGWRVSDDNVAEFKFGGKNNSYSKKSGNGTENTGVIGVMIFEEKTFGIDWSWFDYPIVNRPKKYWYDTDNDPWAFRPRRISNNGPVYGSISFNHYTEYSTSAQSTNNLGTEFGNEVDSKVKKTTFYSEPKPTFTKAIYYDDRKGLEARGIVVDKRKQKPSAFPASTQYCKRV